MTKEERASKEALGYRILRSQYFPELSVWKIVYHTKKGGWAIHEPMSNFSGLTLEECDAMILRLEMNNPHKYIRD